VLTYFGVEPRRPERLLCLVVAGVMFAALALALTVLLAMGEFRVPSPRANYFAYLAVLCSLGLLCAPIPRLAAVLRSLVMIDLGLGMGSFALRRWVEPILPPVYYPASGFQWHSLAAGGADTVARRRVSRCQDHA
jgi:hypothetical protein